MSEEKQGHRWVKLKRSPWLVCQRCDLLLLKNAATERRVRAGCVGQLVQVSAPMSANQREATSGR